MSRLTKITQFLLRGLGVLSLSATVHILLFRTEKLAAAGTAYFAAYLFMLAYDVGKTRPDDVISFPSPQTKPKKK